MRERTKEEKKFVEYQLLKFQEEKRSLMKKPRLTQLLWETTTRCNAGCEHCTCSCTNKNKTEEVDIKYIKKALYEISLRYNPQQVFFCCTGGEPLLRKGLFDVLNYANSLGFRWGMSTNGSLLTKSMVQKLKDAKISSINISIDGLKELHEDFRKLPGAWENIWNGIHMLEDCESLRVLQVTTVCNKRNISQLEKIYRFLVSQGIRYWRILSVDANGRAAENREILLDGKDYDYLFDFINRKNKEKKMVEVIYGCSNYLGLDLELRVRNNCFICMPGLVLASILSNGDIFVCPNVEKRPELIQGNIKTDNFVDVWENRFQYFRNEYRQSDPKCLKCKEWDYCLGGSLHTYNFDKRTQEFCMKEKLNHFN